MILGCAPVCVYILIEVFIFALRNFRKFVGF